MSANGGAKDAFSPLLRFAKVLDAEAGSAGGSLSHAIMSGSYPSSIAAAFSSFESCGFFCPFRKVHSSMGISLEWASWLGLG